MKQYTVLFLAIFATFSISTVAQQSEESTTSMSLEDVEKKMAEEAEKNQSSEQAQEIIKATSLAEFGKPELDDNFSHLPYVNPEAPKGGELVLSDFGNFDTLNPYVLKGQWPASIGLASCGLMTESANELASVYPDVAESVEYPANKSWIIFNLRKDAVYHDGSPIVADDFVFALDTIKEHGRPFLQSFYEDIEKAQALNEHQVKYFFKTTNNMKPVMLAAGSSPVSRSYWQDKDITASTLEPPLSCGPYKISKVDPGRSISYTRVKNWWGENIPIHKGRHNFDEIRYDYYLDLTVQFEAFKAQKIDIWGENSAKRWATEYDIAEVKNGEMIKAELANENPRGIGGYFTNLRKDKFKDVNVRKALLHLYDFEAIQRTLLFGFYKRIESFFPNSDFGSQGEISDSERDVLALYKDQLDEAVLSTPFKAPVTDGSGRDRKNKRIALSLFKEAGWELKDGRLLNANGEQFELEIMTAWPETQRLTLPFIENLKSVGIDASIRLVDTSQWRVRIDDLDFDMYSAAQNFFPPPGPELRSYFGCEAAQIRGSANSMGICDPVIDELIEKIINSKDLDSLKVMTKAMDRILLQKYAVLPLYYNDKQWLAYWNKYGQPENKPKYEIGFVNTWWSQP